MSVIHVKHEATKLPNDQMAHRRRWSEAAIVCKSFEPGEVVSIVAVLYIVNPERLSQWRKRYREGRLSVRKA